MIRGFPVVAAALLAGFAHTAGAASLSLTKPSGLIDITASTTVRVDVSGTNVFLVRAVVLDEKSANKIRWPTADNDFLPRPGSLGLPVVERTITLPRPATTDATSYDLDLAPLAGGARRPVLLEVEPGGTDGAAAQPGDRRRALYQLTGLGVIAFHSAGGSVIRVVRLLTGQPVALARVHQSTKGSSFVTAGVTDGNGLLEIPPTVASREQDPLYLVRGPDGKELTLLRAFPAAGSRDKKLHLGLERGESIVGALMANRNSYGAGDRIHVIGWVAIASPYEESGLRPVPSGTPATIRLRHGNTSTVQDVIAKADERGKIEGDISIPLNVPSGWYSLDAQVGRASTAEREDFMGQRWEYVGPTTIRILPDEVAPAGRAVLRPAPPAFLRITPLPDSDVVKGDPVSVAVRSGRSASTAQPINDIELSIIDTRSGSEIWRARLGNINGQATAVKLPFLDVGKFELHGKGKDAAGASVTAASSLDVHESVVSGNAGAPSPPEPRLRRSPPARRLHITAPAMAKVGDRLPIGIEGPDLDLQGLLVVSRGGVRQSLPFALHNGRAMVELRPQDSWGPLARIEAVALVPSSKGAPAKIIGDATLLTISDQHRRLAVSVVVPPDAHPGEDIVITARVVSGEGAPGRGTRVAFWAEDETWAAGSGYAVPDLGATFLPAVGDPTRADHTLGNTVLPFLPSGDAESLSGAGSARETAGPSIVRESPPPHRSLSDMPLFLADVPLDSDGTAKTIFHVPHHVATYRLYALASAPLPGTSVPGRFGTGTAGLHVARPLLIEALFAPQFFPGEETEVAVLVHLDAKAPPGAVEVTASLEQTTGPPVARLTPASRKAHVPRGGKDPGRVFFRLRGLAPGAVKIHLTARLLSNKDDLQDEVFAQSHLLPLPPSGRSEPLADRGLTGTIHDLLDHHYDCLEEATSRLAALVAFPEDARTVLPAETDFSGLVQAQASRIGAFQIGNGVGMSFWRGDNEAAPYASAYATLVLQRARATGLLVDDQATADGRYLRVLLESTPDTGAPARTPPSIQAMALFALSSLDTWDEDAQEKLDNVFTGRRELPLAAQAFLLMALHRRAPLNARVQLLQDELRAQITEVGAASSVVPPPRKASAGYLSSSRAFTQASVLWAFARTAPNDPVVRRLTRGLLTMRGDVSWGSRHDDAFALLALAETPQAKAAGAASLLVETTLGARPVSATAPNPGITISRTLREGRRTVGPTGSVSDGRIVAMDIFVNARGPFEHVAVDIPLPAGLRATGAPGEKHVPETGSRTRWISHEDRQSWRTTLFASTLPPGKHAHTLYFRAQFPGRYTLLPARIEAMYAPASTAATESRPLVVVP